MKKVLLTGANGLLGQKLVKILAGRADIRLLASSKGEDRNQIRAEYEYRDLNITEFKKVKSVFEEFRPDYVINAAAMTNVDACEKEKELCQEINVKAVAWLCNMCELYSSRLIHVSTDFIFDGESGPYIESDRANPLSWYGLSKYESERFVMDSSIIWAIARTILVYGVSEDGTRSNVVLWAKKSLEEGKTIKVVNDQWRTPTWAEDLARGIVLILDKEVSGIFNISGEEQMSILDLVKRVARFWNLEQSNIQETNSYALNQPAKRPPKTGFILEKAKKELGYQPHSFEESLAEMDQQLKMMRPGKLII